MAFSNSQRMEMHPASYFTKPRKSGQLRKLTRRGWLYRGPWKSRYCLLDGTKLYFYENEQSKGTERTSGVLNLDYFDLCEEGKQKDKRASNVFVVSTSVRGIFDRQTRHFFSADTLPEMNEWIHHIRVAIADARNNRSRAGRSKGGTLESLKRMPSQDSHVASAAPSDTPEKTQAKEETQGPHGTSSIQQDSRLYTPTKNRAKGPTGRRLPQRKSMVSPSKMDQEPEYAEPNGPHRAQSMSALECITEGDSTDRHSWMDNSLDLSNTEGRSASQNALVYKYSSSEESLELPEQGRVKKLSQMLKIPTQAPGSTPGTPGMARNPKFAYQAGETEGSALPVSPTHRLPPTYNRAYQKSETSGSSIYMAPSSPSALRGRGATPVDNSPVLIFTRQLTSLDTKVRGLEQEMVVTRSDLASVHGGVGKVQSEVDRLTQRLERFANQFYQVEKQMANLLTEAQKFYENAEKSAKEAAEMKEQYSVLEKECQRAVALLKETPGTNP